jgi:GNAT superfamily N-acetyltransferase
MYINRLSQQHDRASFNSGVPELDFYLHVQAGQDMKRNLSAVYVLTEDKKNIAGYYTLSQSTLNVHYLPENLANKLPPHRAVPCTLLGRLAVDKRYQGSGYGRALLFHALGKAFRLSKELASYAVIVDAKDVKAKVFYEKYGFIEVNGPPLRMFIPMRGISHMLQLWNIDPQEEQERL